MLTKPLLFLLLQLAVTAFGGPCKLSYKMAIVAIPDDWGSNAELTSSFHIRRSGETDNIAHNSTGYGEVEFDDKKGDCWKENTGYEHVLWKRDDVPFQRCGGVLEFASNGREYGRNGNFKYIWRIDKNFQCDGKPIEPVKDCQNGGGGTIHLKCTNEYHMDILFPEFKATLEKAMENNNYNNLYKDYNDLVQKLGDADLNYGNQIESCKEDGNWTIHESCAVLFFRPIIAVIASYRTTEIDDQAEIEKWIQPSFTSSQWSTDGDRVRELVNLTRMAFAKEEVQVDSRLFKREMIYTMLHRANPAVFPWDQSPFSRHTQQWYEYAKGGNDGELRQFLDLEIDEEVRKFCNDEATRSLLCSFMAAKNKYERSKLYLPHQWLPDLNRTSVISVSAYYSEDGLYASFKNELERYLQTADIKDEVNKLGTKLGGYFQTLARFDNEIAKADVGYLRGAIEKNDKQLQTNKEKMKELVKGLEEDKEKCQALKILEILVEVAVAIAVTVATGGAGAPLAFNSISKAVESTKAVVEAVADTGAVQELVEFAQDSQTFEARKTGIKNSLANLMAKLENNTVAIEGMQKIQQAVLDGGSFNSTDQTVKQFLEAYNNYTPAVTKTDLAELNENYTQLLETFAEIESKGGFLCTLALGSGIKEKNAQAKLTWTSINSLLTDIHDQQFQLIDAITKVVRSKLDEMAAKKLETDLDYYSYNFEIIIRHQLAVRVSAQQVCDTFQMLNNDQEDGVCTEIANTTFLDYRSRIKIEALDKQLQEELRKHETNKRVAYIPVIGGQGSKIGAINWDDLINGKVVELVLPSNDSKFLKDNGWSEFPNRLALLKSMELFLPNVLAIDENEDSAVELEIAAIQQNVVVNDKPDARRYTLKSVYPITTRSWYTLNEVHCEGKAMDLYVNDGMSKYCIPDDSGRFTNGLKLSPPVSMFSKFQVKLTNPITDENTKQILEQYRPVDDTLKLRARIQVYSNPAGGFERPGSKHRAGLPKPRPPPTAPCPEGQYRRVVTTRKQDCVPCPRESIHVASGSYCIYPAAASWIAKVRGQV